MAISGIPSHLYQFLDTSGDGTGTMAATGDYSSSATPMYYQVPANKIAEIHRMIICIGGKISFLLNLLLVNMSQFASVWFFMCLVIFISMAFHQPFGHFMICLFSCSWIFSTVIKVFT